jgi:hypothetical protein
VVVDILLHFIRPNSPLLSFMNLGKPRYIFNKNAVASLVLTIHSLLLSMMLPALQICRKCNKPMHWPKEMLQNESMMVK